MAYYIYILKSSTTGKRYTGSTQNLEARLKAHNDGLSPYTKGRGPWELIYSEEFPTRSDAMKREKFLKTGEGRDFLNEILS
jgi:putative endonuclease